MKFCETCQVETSNRRFCSKSCSAKKTNTEKPRKQRKLCIDCFTEITRATRCASCNGKNKRRSNTEILSAGKLESHALLKRALLETGRQYRCAGLNAACEVADMWNGAPITLQIDHINGDRFDNRETNLRFLCLNCHSQTDTFCNKKSAIEIRKSLARDTRIELVPLDLEASILPLN